MRISCADLHPGCPADLRGASPEDVVLAYVVHSRDCRTARTVGLDELLDRITPALTMAS